MSSSDGTRDRDRAERITKAVERDARARRRMLRLYWGLLFVPLALVVYFLFRGQTEREMVVQQLEASLAPVRNDYREIKPALERVQDIDRYRQSVKEEVAELVRPIQSEYQDIRPVLERLEKTGELVARLEQVSTRLELQDQELREREADIRKWLQTMDIRIRTLEVVPEPGVRRPPLERRDPDDDRLIPERRDEPQDWESKLRQLELRLERVETGRGLIPIRPGG